MNKYDWLELATRVLGVWFVATGVIGVIGFLGFQVFLGDALVEATTMTLFNALGTSFLGTCMVLLAPGFVGWLRDKDARALARTPQTPPAAERAGSETV